MLGNLCGSTHGIVWFTTLKPHWWGCSSVVKPLSSKRKVLGSILDTTKWNNPDFWLQIKVFLSWVYLFYFMHMSILLFLFVVVYMYVLSAYLLPTKVRRRGQIPRNWSYGWSWTGAENLIQIICKIEKCSELLGQLSSPLNKPLLKCIPNLTSLKEPVDQICSFKFRIPLAWAGDSWYPLFPWGELRFSMVYSSRKAMRKSCLFRGLYLNGISEC